MASKTSIDSPKLRLLLAVALLLAASAQAQAPAPAPAPAPGPSQATLCPPGFKNFAEYKAAVKLRQGSVQFTFSGTLNFTAAPAAPVRPGITVCLCKTATINVGQPPQASGNLIVCVAANAVVVA